MDVLLVLVGVLLAAAFVVAVVALLRAERPRPTPRPGPSPWHDERRSGARVALDVTVHDPDTPSVQRLVQEAASRALDAAPALEVVEVVDRAGTTLGEVRRVPPVRRDVDLPLSLHEPHVRRSRAPDPLRSQRPSSGPAGVDAAAGGPPAVPSPHAWEEVPDDLDTPGARPFADRYDLPASVRAGIDDPEDPAAVVAALLAAAGRPVERRGDLVLSGDVAVVVALVDDGGDRSLSRAYLKVRSSGAPYGLVIRIGYADPVLVHKREVAAPEVRHAPAQAVQRMADAVALGEDPLAFALGPPVTR